MFNESENFDARAKEQFVTDMNENIDVHTLLLKQNGPVRSGLKFGRTRRVATWCHSFGALRYPYSALCGFRTSSSHNSDSSGGSAKNSWSMSACRNAVCKSSAIATWSHSGFFFFFRSCELTVNNGFPETVSRVSTLRLSAPLVTIEILQNQYGLHATIFLSIDPSRLYHRFASR